MYLVCCKRRSQGPVDQMGNNHGHIAPHNQAPVPVTTPVSYVNQGSVKCCIFFLYNIFSIQHFFLHNIFLR